MTQPTLSAVARHNWSKPNGSQAHPGRAHSEPRPARVSKPLEANGAPARARTACRAFLAGPAPAPSPWGLGESVRPFASGVVVGGPPPDGESGRGPVVCKSATFNGPCYPRAPCSRACVEIVGAPSPAPPAMKVRFWGVRGSLPVPGAKTDRYGGNTSCVEVRSAAGTRVVIDAGTGIRKLGKELAGRRRGRPRQRPPADQPHPLGPHPGAAVLRAASTSAGNKLSVYARQRDDLHLQAVFASQTHDPYFPVPFDEAEADIEFHELADSAKFDIGDVQVACTRLNHPYIATAYRLTADGASVVYVSDTAPFTDILFEDEFIARPPTPGAELPAKDRQKLAAHARGRGSPVRGRRPGHLRHDVHARGLPAHPALRPLAPGGRGRGLRARPGRRGWRCFTTRPSAPTPRSTRSSPTRARRAAKTARGAGRRGRLRRARGRARAGLMELSFWGVRGSIPAPGPATIRYGGNTACVSVRPSSDGGSSSSTAAPGARNLGITLMEGAVRQGHAARRASCCRTPTGTTSRASRSSCRCTSRATSFTSSAAPRARRCWKASSRGRWRRSISRCRR